MSERFLRIAVLWFLACVLLGAYMGATRQFMDKPVHVHGNLLGWVSCALFALVHRGWPQLQSQGSARAHFWLHNIGLLVMVAGLMLMTRGVQASDALIGVGSILLVGATAAFAWAVWQTTRPALGSSEARLTASW